MSRIIILCDSIPDDPSNGLHLRIQNLVARLVHEHECGFIGCESQRELKSLDVLSCFKDVFLMQPRPRSNRSWRRHLRRSNAWFLEESSPEFFQYATGVLAECIQRWDTQAIVSFAPALTELAARCGIPKILDICDSTTLTIQRRLSNRSRRMKPGERVLTSLKAMRQRGREGEFVRQFNITTTISEADRGALLRVSGVEQDRIFVVPNGVADAALKVDSSSHSGNRSVIFWGNLDFPPNWTAIEYFYEKIYSPYLADKDIAWHIVGGKDKQDLYRRIRHPNIRFHGFVEDLFAFAARQGVMVNPMIEGSGLKNKVLESFAVRLPVVSTSLGVEAIGGVAGRHYLVADSAKQFAASIVDLLDNQPLRESITNAARRLVATKFSWSVVGRQYSELVCTVAGAAKDRLKEKADAR